MMISINNDLSEEGIEIAHRSIRAVTSAMRRLNASGPIGGSTLEQADFPITIMNLSSHVYCWYKKLYADKLKIDFTPAKFPFLIHGDVFEVKLPLFFGKFSIISNKTHVTGRNIMNTVDMVQELTEPLRLALTSIDENKLQELFITCLLTSQLMQKFKKNDFIDSAIKDSFVSCENIVIRPKSPDLSAWHSVQFAEKILKFYISLKTAKVKRTHSFNELHKEARKLGYNPSPKINWELLSSITPSVRYEPGNVRVETAVDINIEAWRVAFNVLHQVEI